MVSSLGIVFCSLLDEACSTRMEHPVPDFHPQRCKKPGLAGRPGFDLRLRAQA
jgi:hypothetical protein